MLVFDRMARGLRLSIALEARLHRERRWDAEEIEREAQGERPRRRQARAIEAEPAECDRERDDDGLPDDAPLAQRIGRLKTIIEGSGAPEPAAVSYRFETLAAPRAERASTDPEPWDIPSPADPAEVLGPPWRGSG
jgi:hypothetical protein